MREGFRITELAIEEVIKNLRPGVTELQMVGIAQRVIYENGAEYEGLPMYVFSKNPPATPSLVPLTESSKRRFGSTEPFRESRRIFSQHWHTGLRWKTHAEKRELVEFGLKSIMDYRANQSRCESMRYCQRVLRIVRFKWEKGQLRIRTLPWNRMIEVEAPWMETTSVYELQPNMTFQVDSFVSGSTFGLRWEKGVVVTKDGCESLCSPIGDIIELDF